ncbi:ubiquinol-cytochrome c reductase subunit 9 [Paragonimus westermani]|uniref:Complex III subunit 9 n=1 Tax=Paragonimus westermani TaxID=34504 RepID=A0A5J4ND26_9TREM|nr:ubiquinol-cytochrome c reductase subunit 9 [Paragonimus westermani]
MLHKFYASVLRYPSRLFLAVVVSAIGFEFVLNDVTDKIFLSVNHGKLWRDVRPVAEKDSTEE